MEDIKRYFYRLQKIIGETGSADEITNVGTKYLKINSQIKAIAATYPFSKEL
jgi:hypothetical protein